MATDTSEKGLETLIVRHTTGTDGLPPMVPVGTGAGPSTDVAARPNTALGGIGYLAGSPKDYDRAQALDVYQLFAFLKVTQPDAFRKLAMQDEHDARDINRLRFLTRLSSEIGKRGVIDVLRKGIEHHPANNWARTAGEFEAKSASSPRETCARSYLFDSDCRSSPAA